MATNSAAQIMAREEPRLIPETASFSIGKNRSGDYVAWLLMKDQWGESHCVGVLFKLDHESGFLEECASQAAKGIALLQSNEVPAGFQRRSRVDEMAHRNPRPPERQKDRILLAKPSFMTGISDFVSSKFDDPDKFVRWRARLAGMYPRDKRNVYLRSTIGNRVDGSPIYRFVRLYETAILEFQLRSCLEIHPQ